VSATEDAIARAAALVRKARKGVAFTGAGISTESGIPDFRSPGGIWARYDPEEFSYPRFVSNEASRQKYWQWGMELYPRLRDAEPNAGHLALVALEQAGHLGCVITQNVDDLHRRAGSRDVVEIHGNATWVGCLSCEKTWSREVIHGWLLAGNSDPRCDDCGGLLKPKTISFGQAMPERETRRAFELAASCDLMLVVGSSLAVFPAAQLVPDAKRVGAHLVIVNLVETPYDEIADVVLRGQAGDVLTDLVRRISDTA
jgi:NAD-dependent deacetylase